MPTKCAIYVEVDVVDGNSPKGYHTLQQKLPRRPNYDDLLSETEDFRYVSAPNIWFPSTQKIAKCTCTSSTQPEYRDFSLHDSLFELDVFEL